MVNYHANNLKIAMNFLILCTEDSIVLETLKKRALDLGLKCIDSTPGVNIFLNDTAFAKINENGYVFYRYLFYKRSFEQVNKDYLCLKVPIVQNFIKEFYGKYVTCTISQDRNLSVYRDITGSMPVFYKRIDCGLIIASSIKLIDSLCGINLEINKQYVMTYVFNGRFISNSTPFCDIYELPPGCALNVKDNFRTNIDPLWLSHLAKKFLNSKHKILKEHKIVSTLKKVIKGYIEDQSIVQIDYSGGLDSTCLLLATHNILNKEQILVTLHAQPNELTSESNETIFVQETMKSLNLDYQSVEFEEKKRLFSHVDEAADYPDYIDSFQVMPHNNQTKIFTLNGEGGDQIFCAFPLFEALIDLIQDGKCELLDNKLSTFKEFSNLTCSKIISLLSKHMKNFPSSIIAEKVKDEKIRYKRYFSNLEVIEDINSLKLRDRFKKFPGKFYHIELFLNALSETLGTFEDSKRLFPMLEEPFLELILTIPTYLFFEDNFDRFPIRNAFSKAFYPYKALWRKDKGYYFNMNFDLLKKNRQYISGLFENGQLMKLGLINKSFFNLVDKALVSKNEHDLSIISNVYLIEKFFKKWGIQ